MHPGLLPTASLPPTPMPVQVQPVQLPLPPPDHRAWMTIVAWSLGILIAFFVGLAIGRGTAPVAATTAGSAAPATNVGRLKVSSKPADGNVVVDGRFVGVAPIERVDLEPGKHSIVIDVFGFQPYAGTFEIEARDELNLKVLLAPIGARDAKTTGTAVGARTIVVVQVPVPASSLQPAAAAPAPPQQASQQKSAPARRYEPPPRPHRDCSGEQRDCSSRCWFATGDCNRGCPGCGSCVSPLTNDDCKRSCEACQYTCKQNSQFCESNCEQQRRSCDASNQ